MSEGQFFSSINNPISSFTVYNSVERLTEVKSNLVSAPSVSKRTLAQISILNLSILGTACSTVCVIENVCSTFYFAICVCRLTAVPNYRNVVLSPHTNFPSLSWIVSSLCWVFCAQFVPLAAPDEIYLSSNQFLSESR